MCPKAAVVVGPTLRFRCPKAQPFAAITAQSGCPLLIVRKSPGPQVDFEPRFPFQHEPLEAHAKEMWFVKHKFSNFL